MPTSQQSSYTKGFGDAIKLEPYNPKGTGDYASYREGYIDGIESWVNYNYPKHVKNFLQNYFLGEQNHAR